VNPDWSGCCLQNEHGGRISKRAEVALSKERFTGCPWTAAAGIPAAAMRSALQAGGKPGLAKRSPGIALFDTEHCQYRSARLGLDGYAVRGLRLSRTALRWSRLPCCYSLLAVSMIADCCETWGLFTCHGLMNTLKGAAMPASSRRLALEWYTSRVLSSGLTALGSLLL